MGATGVARSSPHGSGSFVMEDEMASSRQSRRCGGWEEAALGMMAVVMKSTSDGNKQYVTCCQGRGILGSTRGTRLHATWRLELKTVGAHLVAAALLSKRVSQAVLFKSKVGNTNVHRCLP